MNFHTVGRHGHYHTEHGILSQYIQPWARARGWWEGACGTFWLPLDAMVMVHSLEIDGILFLMAIVPFCLGSDSSYHERKGNQPSLLSFVMFLTCPD